MSMIEDHLRTALRELGNEIPAAGVPTLRLAESRSPAAGTAWVGARPRHRTRWLAPAAAAATVLAIAVAVIAIGGHARRARTTAPAACARPILATGQVPAYYIALTGTKRPYPSHPYVAGIFRTSTGAQVATFAAPGRDKTVVDVSAAADDRTFAIATQAASANLPATRFYLVRFSPSGSAGISPLAMPAVPAGASFDTFALSPAGSRLAVAFEPNKHAPKLTEEVRVLDVGTGAVRTWTSAQGAVAGDTVDPQSLSWSADSTTLALNWYGSRPNQQGLTPPSGLRLLDVAAPGSSLVAGSKLSVRFFTRAQNRATEAGYLSDIAMLTPDCQSVVAAITAFHGSDGGFAEFSARTGRLRRVLDWRPMGRFAGGGPMDVLWASATGRTLVVYAPPGHSNRIGILRGGRLTMLPQSARISFPGAAW